MSSERPTPIYLDHNATTPIFPEVADVIRASWAGPDLNPSSQHAFGHRARRALDEAHDRIAELLGAKFTLPAPDRVIFTSGGTEANNLAVFGTLKTSAGRPAHPSRNHVIISAIEH
ncbi:MAG TPA: aminotransferase class V-fold PLP-dependent enzyme, partial [Lacipirellulaceae bacterium]